MVDGAKSLGKIYYSELVRPKVAGAEGAKVKNSKMTQKTSRSHEPWFSTHTGYERSMDRRWRTISNGITRSPAAGSGSGQLKHREVSRQVPT